MKPTTPSEAGRAALFAAAMLMAAGPSQAQGADEEPTARPPDAGMMASATRAATAILSQPVRDVGLARSRVPETLQRAAKDPYAMPQGRDCKAVGSEIEALNASLGSDLDLSPRRDNRFGRLAQAGGRAVVNSVIPFRVVVREVTGAAPAERRLQEAVALGYARRGFLRGVSQMWKCSDLSLADAEPGA